VTQLGQIMLEELRRRNYAESTIQTYIHTVEHFSQYFQRPPDQLSPEHIRQCQAALFTREVLQDMCQLGADRRLSDFSCV
jgi:integrase/recombinase XerD